MNKSLGRSIILGILAIIIGVFISKQLSKKGSAEGPKISFRSKIVEVKTVKTASIPINIIVSGRLKASNRMELYTEVSGVLSNQNFKEGNRFSSGQTLVQVNSSEFEAQLKAQKSTFIGLISQALADIALDFSDEYPKWLAFVEQIDPSSPLPELPKLNNQKLKQFLSTRSILSNYYTIKSQEERLRKHRITAPYSGILSEALIDPGTLVRVGQKLGTFVQDGRYELEAAVSKYDLQFLQLGNKVKLNSQEGESYTGTISRINSVINTNTQLVSVFMNVTGPKLREGLYLSASISGGNVDNALKIKRNLLVDKDAVFIVDADSSLRLQRIEVLSYSENYAIIKGIPNGALLPTSMVSGGFEGMKVVPSLSANNQ